MADAANTPDSQQPDLTPDLFEALVSAWTEILVADYEERHVESGQGDDSGIIRVQ